MVLGVLTALACASAIGAAMALVVISIDKPAFEAPELLTHAPRSGECAVVAWRTGTIYCFGNKTADLNGAMDGQAVVVQAQAGQAR